MPPLIVTAAVLRKDGRILITRRPEGKPHEGFWEFPGGKLEPDESPEECLKREIGEELALEIDVQGIFEVIYHRYDWGPVLLLFYDCRPHGDRIHDREVAEHRWVLAQDLPRYPLLPADTPLVTKLIG
jgi:8-oxo-dGTP diphosphatase